MRGFISRRGGGVERVWPSQGESEAFLAVPRSDGKVPRTRSSCKMALVRDERRSIEDALATARSALEVPLLRLVGTSFVDDDDPAAGLTLTVGDGALNAVDTLHAGTIATLLETTAYLALLPDLGPDENAATHAFSASYLRASRSGDVVRCTARVVHRTRRLAFVEAELRRGDDLIATATVTKSMVPRPPGDAPG